MSRLIRICTAACICNVVACGHAFLPAPTSKRVSSSDIVGKWEYKTNYETVTVVIDFNPNGEFEQRLPNTKTTPAKTETGTWSLSGSQLSVKDLWIWDEFKHKWKRSDNYWSVIDSNDRPGRVAIFGGDHSDPDSHSEFRKLK